MQKFLLIGLGNPGKKYAATRHNAGKMFAKWLQKTQPQKVRPFVADKADKLEAIESESFMNSSGGFVYNAYKNYNNYKDYSRLLVAHDDLDLPLGQFKIQFGRGPRDHKGLLSIYQALGTKKFWHVRIGIDNRKNAIRHPEESASKDLAGGDKDIFSASLDSSPDLKSGFRMTAKRESGETYTLKPFSREEKEKLYNVFADIRDDPAI